MKALVSLRDGALTPPLFSRLDRALKALGETGLRQTYQTTFWFDFSTEPSCVVEEAILALPRVRGAIGAEWWLSRMRTSNVQVDFHQDRDEKLALSGGPLRHPLISSVLFLNRCRGGLLAVTRELPNPRNVAFAPDVIDFDLVEPKPNRFVSFDGTLTHGVLDADNQLPGRRLPLERALRRTIAINFWKARPTGVSRFSDRRVYGALRPR